MQPEALARTRQRLIDACTRLMLRGAMAGADVAAVEREAGVAHGSLRRHFPSRDAIVDAALAGLRAAALAPKPAATLHRDTRDAHDVARSAGSASSRAGATRRGHTRSALVEAGKRLLRSGHIDAVSIDDIVREAGVGKGSFFNHFATREALVAAAVERVRQELNLEISTRCEGVADPLGRLMRGLLASFRYRFDHGLGVRAVLPPAPGAADVQDPTNALLRADLQMAIDAGAARLPDIETGVALVLGVSEIGLARLLDFDGEPARQRRLMHELCLTLLAAVGADARRHRALADDALRAVLDDPTAATV